MKPAMKRKNIDCNKTILIDLDGTIVDTDYANFISYKKAIFDVTNITINNLNNERFSRKMLKKIIPLLSQVDYEKIIEAKNSIFSTNLNKTSLNFPIIAMIKKYSKTNKIILVTNSHKERALSLLKYYKIFGLFDYLFFKEDYQSNNEQNKFKYVLDYLNLLPTSIVIFDNERSSIKDAISLNVPTENIIIVEKGK